MRWIILTLLLANLGLGGYLYWEQTRPDTDVPAPTGAQMNNLALDEATRAELRNLAQQTSAQAQTEPTPPPARCIRITGLQDAAQADLIASRLGALEVGTERTRRQRVVRSDYWVVLGPFDSQALARERLGDIQAQGVESFLITQGRLEGWISLGLFSQQSNAQRRQQTLQEQDIQARVEQVDRTEEQLELTVGRDDAGLISDAALESLLQEFEGVSYQRYSC